MPARAILFVFGALALGGCFRSSGLGAADDAPRPDLGVPTDGSLGPDLGPVETCECCGVTVPLHDPRGCELGTCDPYCLRPDPFCSERPLGALCDYSRVPAGVPTSIRVLFGTPGGDDCFCAETLRCAATQIGEYTLHLQAEICEDPDVDCDGCSAMVEGRCELPALEASGTYRVLTNGRDAFELQVAPSDAPPEGGLSCQRAAGDGGGCGTIWPPRAELTTSLVCHPTSARAGSRVAIEVTHDCPACSSPAGPCTVDIGGDQIRVTPSTLDPSCDIACPPACFERVDTCLTPELPEGRWQVSVVGLEGYASSLEVGEGADDGVVCGPATAGG